MTALSFIVPGEVRGKGRPRIVKIGSFSRLAADQKTVSYENLVALMASEAMKTHGMAMQHFTGPVAVDLTAYFAPPASAAKRARAAMLSNAQPPAKKPDLDNIVKVLDGLNGVVWRDDCQIVDVTARKRYAERPSLWVRVAPYLPPFEVI